MISVTALVIVGIAWIPFALGDTDTFFEAAVVLFVPITLVVVLIWTSFFIKYVLYDEYLYVKGGPFRSKISYDEITKIAPTQDIFTGYRILSAKSGIEVFYKSGPFGSVKISPKDRKRFLTELAKRCPHAQIDDPNTS